MQRVGRVIYKDENGVIKHQPIIRFSMTSKEEVIVKNRLTCSICLVTLFLMLSSCGKHADIKTVYEYTPEQIGDMLIAFCTTDKDGRYTKLREGIEEIVQYIDPPTKGAVVVHDFDAIIIEYHAEVMAYMTDHLKELIILNRELLRLDEYAAAQNITIKALSVDITEASGGGEKYEFTIYAEIKDAYGTTKDTVQHGYFTMRDGLVDVLSFDDGMKGLFGITQ